MSPQDWSDSLNAATGRMITLRAGVVVFARGNLNVLFKV